KANNKKNGTQSWHKERLWKRTGFATGERGGGSLYDGEVVVIILRLLSPQYPRPKQIPTFPLGVAVYSIMLGVQ
ncbi:MAG: hypothetical protein L3J65_08895, partial [Robiginitomaculum sp.]|nr:hypothetical protein [Robiginitomaculum sp.]